MKKFTYYTKYKLPKLPKEDLFSRSRFSKPNLLIFAFIFAAVGGYFIYSSFASGFSTSTEAEGGTVSSPASVINDSNASGGQAVRFGSSTGGSCPDSTPNAADGPDPWGGCFPGPQTTGVPEGTTLTGGPGLTITTPGTTVNAVDVPWIDVKAPNVTIKNSYIHGDSPYVIYNFSTGLIVEDSTIEGSMGTAISPNEYTLRRVDISNVENGADISNPSSDDVPSISNVTIEDSYIHALSNNETSHSDGIQMGRGTQNIVIHHNYVRVQDSGTPNSNACIIMWTKPGTQNANVRIDNNKLDGRNGTYTIFAPEQAANNIFINNNRILSGIYGHATGVDIGVTVNEYNGNVDDATGVLLSPND